MGAGIVAGLSIIDWGSQVSPGKERNMEQATIEIATEAGPHPITSYTYSCAAGLAVHRTFQQDGTLGHRWTVTHIATGKTVTSGHTWRRRAQAAAFAWQVALDFDWTQDERAIQRAYKASGMFHRLCRGLTAANNA